MTALISVARRAELAAALARGDVPFMGDDGVVYVGNPKIMLTRKTGPLTQAGSAWIQMGGVNPMRNGEPILDGGKNCHEAPLVFRQACLAPDRGRAALAELLRRGASQRIWFAFDRRGSRRETMEK